MARRGRRREVGLGTSRSSRIRAVPAWRTPTPHEDLAKALAAYILWRLDHPDTTAAASHANTAASTDREATS